jgi:hypothetical protein
VAVSHRLPQLIDFVLPSLLAWLQDSTPAAREAPAAARSAVPLPSLPPRVAAMTPATTARAARIAMRGP